MILKTCDPRRLIPYHPFHPNRLKPYPPQSTDGHPADPNGCQERLPRIPVFEVPPDLEYLPSRLASKLGDYILYNGHHRRMAAICAQVSEVCIAVLHTDEDLGAIEPWEVLVGVPSRSIADHQERVYASVRECTSIALEDQREHLSRLKLV